MSTCTFDKSTFTSTLHQQSRILWQTLIHTQFISLKLNLQVLKRLVDWYHKLTRWLQQVITKRANTLNNYLYYQTIRLAFPFSSSKEQQLTNKHDATRQKILSHWLRWWVWVFSQLKTRR